MNMALLMEVLNDHIYNILGFPPMMVVVIVLAAIEALAWTGYEARRTDKLMRDTPGWFDLPLALIFAWFVAVAYGYWHQDVSLGVIFWTAVWALVGIAVTVPVLWYRASLRKKRNQVSC